MNPEKDKKVPLLGHMTACRPAFPSWATATEAFRFSSRTMEHLQNIDSLMVLQGERRKHQARLHFKVLIDLVSNTFNNGLNLNCQEGIMP